MILSLCYLKQIWYFTVWNHNEKVNFSWCWQHDGCFFLNFFVSVISKLIKPYHCCVYGSFCHICLCINANKDVWLVLSGMMAISSGKNAHKFFCCGCTRTKVDSLFVLFSSAQWRLIFMLWFVHQEVALPMVAHSLSERKD